MLIPLIFAVGDDGFGGLPEDFNLKPNFPNPFNPSTQITYEVPAEAHVTLTVYDVIGRQITTLVDDPQHRAGNFTVAFNGASFSSGVYIVRLASGSTSITQKMTLIK